MADVEESAGIIAVKILFFAQARERTKLRESSINFKRGNLKARELFAKVLDEFPGLKPLEKCIILARNKTYLDFDSDEDICLKPEDELAVIPPISAGEIIVYINMDIVKLTEDKISVEEVSDSVAAEGCGAISLFVGTTRDNFENKKVVRLEYEAYEPMALNEMKNICSQVREKWTVENIAFVHRLGLVPVKEASIVIAISSPHRQESLEAVHFAINALKKSVPIWKKEVYAAEGKETIPAEWKANPECAWKDNNKHPSHSS